MYSNVKYCIFLFDDVFCEKREINSQKSRQPTDFLYTTPYKIFLIPLNSSSESAPPVAIILSSTSFPESAGWIYS